MNKALENNCGPKLADGIAVGDLIDLEQREVLNRIFTDPDIYQLELEKIWAKQWICVGHESEIPEVGDFMTRTVGDDGLIISRDRDGNIQAMLNMCPHRGAEVCRTEAGNTSVFRCIYHGWVFNLDGTLRGAPHLNKIYSDEEKNDEKMNLRKPRVELFAGIIFVNWDDNAPSFEDSLGDFKYYLNIMFNRPKNGMVVLGAPQRFVINANWKTAAEQFGGDGLHAGQLHRSLSDLTGADRNDPAMWQLLAPKVNTADGHNIICFDLSIIYKNMVPEHENIPAMQKLSMLPPPGVPLELVPELAEIFSPEELHLLANYSPATGSLFPNIGLWSTTQVFTDGGLSPYLSFRTYAPRGLNQFEFTNWTLVARDASDDYRERIKRSLSFTQGAAGFVEQDDAETWPGIHKASAGFIGRQQSNKYWGLAGTNPPQGWPDKGLVYSGFHKDDTQWMWWQRYFKELCS